MSWGNPQLAPFVLQVTGAGSATAYTNPLLLTSYGVQAAALKRVANDVQVASCVSASNKCDQYISDRYPLPLLAFDYDLVELASHLAIYACLDNVGHNPEAGYDDQIEKRYLRAIETLRQVQKQAANLNVKFNSPNPPNFNMPTVITHRQRGWEGRGGPFRGNGGRVGFF